MFFFPSIDLELPCVKNDLTQLANVNCLINNNVDKNTGNQNLLINLNYSKKYILLKHIH